MEVLFYGLFLDNIVMVGDLDRYLCGSLEEV